MTWVPASPKDAILTWSPPRFVNGRLRSYLVAFSHDELEWRNQTVDPYTTTTQVSAHHSNNLSFSCWKVPTLVYLYIWRLSQQNNIISFTPDLYHFLQIQDLVSNTNYTLHIAGVTRKGVGASTTVFIYIRATLEGEPQITTECKSFHGACKIFKLLRYA